MNILIAPDSFKDCMRALEVAEALSRGIEKVIPHVRIRVIPMADGGEGTVESVIDATGGQMEKVTVRDPLMRTIPSFYGISGDGSTAVIEMAAASGLELLEQRERNPWLTSTCGTGELIAHALDKGCRKIMLGIGGSATNDCGMGMARALGVEFLDGEGNLVPHGGGALKEVRQIRMEGLDPRIGETEIRVACDVTNPLTGPDGASYVYGPQKGADRSMVERLDKNLARFAELVKDQLGRSIDRVPGAGAAGGLGGGLMAFLGARLVKGFDMVAEICGLEEAISGTGLVITGEGKLDSQTRFGKTPFGVAQLAQKYEKPVIGVAGTLEPGFEALYDLGFQAILSIQERPSDLATAIKNAPLLLESTGERIARMLEIRF
ncbi:MAG: glycerate kinase [Bacteroidetes bacterium]|nr:glycerate kinase [Bacteroidota bacterium]